MEQFSYAAIEVRDVQFAFSSFETKPHFEESTRQRLNRLFRNQDNVFLLQGSGFNMTNQIDQWVNEFNYFDPETKSRLVEKIMSDVTGFYHEFLSKRDVFPFDLEFKNNEHGEKIVYASKYGQPLENITDSNEREGSLLEGIKTAIELMKNAEPNTVIYLTSPEGWSGLPTGAHPDSQTYVYWIDKDGDLKAMTLRTDIDLQSSEKLIGTKQEDKSNTERIKDVVKTPIEMKVVNDGFIAVLDKIEEASNRKFNKLRNEVRNRDLYKELAGNEDHAVKIILNQLRQSIVQNINGSDDYSIKNLATIIGRSILDMQNEVNKRIKRYKESTIVVGYDSPETKYQVLAQEVKEIKGCSNGIQEQRGFGFDSKGSLNFRCHKCNGVNTRPYEGYVSECKHCHEKFDKCGA